MTDHISEQSIHQINKTKKLFLPTLNNWDAISFWLGMVILFSFFGTAVQFIHIHSLNDALALFLDFFIIQGSIVFSIVGYVHLNLENLQRLSMKAQSRRIILAAFLLTPPANLIGKVIEFLLINDIRVFDRIYIEIVVDIVLAVLLTTLLLYYFRAQYDKIRQAEQKYRQKLIEQNEQLKARITPHFFFNMLNTLQYLSETEPKKSVALIGDISQLYRVSFADVKEIALTDELALCEHYLKIEHYRFGSKLIVTWDLPEEDILYDMVITSLTLQMILEKIVLMIVEISIETIYIQVQIRWENDIVAIDLLANLPTTKIANQAVEETLTNNLNFNIQIKNLQYYFGETATITYHMDHSDPPAYLITQIRYPLVDNVNMLSS